MWAGSFKNVTTKLFTYKSYKEFIYLNMTCIKKLPIIEMHQSKYTKLTFLLPSYKLNSITTPFQ